MLVNMFYSAFIAMFSTMCGYVVAAVDFGGREQSLKQEVEQLRERVEELEKELKEARDNYDELYEEDDEYIERKREEFKAELANKDDIISTLALVIAGGVVLTALLVFVSIVKSSPLMY